MESKELIDNLDKIKYFMFFMNTLAGMINCKLDVNVYQMKIVDCKFTNSKGIAIVSVELDLVKEKITYRANKTKKTLGADATLINLIEEIKEVLNIQYEKETPFNEAEEDRKIAEEDNEHVQNE